MRKAYPLSTPATALVAMLLLASAGAAAFGYKTDQSTAKAGAAPPMETASPTAIRLAKEFEPRVSALLQQIARDKRISRKAVEAALGIHLGAVPTQPGRPKSWKLHGLFEPGHGFLIELENREHDVQLTVSGSATGPAGCHLETNRIRSALVEQLHYEATEMGQGKRPFTLLRPAQSSWTPTVLIRLFAQTVVDSGGANIDCTYLLDVAGPGV